MKKIAIVGAGPAGIYTAMLLKNLPAEIILFEQNEVIGEKLKMTGGGKMNLCNKVFSVKQFNSSQPNLLKKFFKNPVAQNPIEIFEALGIDYVWEENRALLASQDASLEIERLEEVLHSQKNLTIKLESKVYKVVKERDQFELTLKSPRGLSREMVDVLILSEGGMFRVYDLGESDFIYALPLQLDHDISPVSPSLSPLTISENPFGNLSGISFLVKLTDPLSKKSITNDLILTHGGISGPAVLDFSAILSGSVMSMNFLPTVLEKDFVAEFQSLREGKNRVRSFLKKYVPLRFCDFLLVRSEISNDLFIADISKEKVKLLRKNIFHFSVENVFKQPFEGSWTTKGGVNLNQIKMSTLESKMHPNLFFAGEMLDIDGLCGGYNISFAVICAKVVSDCVLKKIV